MRSPDCFAISGIEVLHSSAGQIPASIPEHGTIVATRRRRRRDVSSRCLNQLVNCRNQFQVFLLPHYWRDSTRWGFAINRLRYTRGNIISVRKLRRFPDEAILSVPGFGGRSEDRKGKPKMRVSALGSGHVTVEASSGGTCVVLKFSIISEMI
jgi:hypothetical protein